MKAYLIDPLVGLGLVNGYNRPLDRHDFDGTQETNVWGNRGHVPDWAHEWVPGMGELKRFSNLTGIPAGSAAGVDMFSNGTTKLAKLGQPAITSDGRIFRYASMGAAASAVGKVYQSAAPIPDHLALTAAAASVGDGGASAPIVVTPGATAGAANLYAEGTLTVSVGPDPGRTYRISGHPAIVASVAFNLYLDRDDRVQVAWSTATRYGLHHNPYKTCIIAATTVTAPAVGVAMSIIAANTTAENYGWLQTRGIAAVLINGTPGVGIGVVTSATTAGAVDVAAVAAEINVRIIGRMAQVGVSTEYNAVILSLD